MDDAELGAVLCALAGPRRGDVVAGVDAPPIALRALRAATGGGDAADGAGARIVVAGEGEPAARAASRLLRPGGRLVSTAPDAGVAAARAGACGLVLRHVEPVGTQVAWSAVAPAAP